MSPPVSHLDYAAGRLDPGPCAPPGDKGGGEHRLREIDRNRVIAHAANSRRRDRPAIHAAIRVQPIGNFGVALAETSRRNASRIRTGTVVPPR